MPIPNYPKRWTTKRALAAFAALGWSVRQFSPREYVGFVKTNLLIVDDDQPGGAHVFKSGPHDRLIRIAAGYLLTDDGKARDLSKDTRSPHV